MPRIEMTPAVKIALYALRIYLFVILVLILVKFMRIFPLKTEPPKRAAVMAQAETDA